MTKKNNIERAYLHSESNKIDILDLRIHYRTTAALNGSTNTIVLLHGLNSSLHTWDGWHDALSQHINVVSLDLPGFGLTGGFTHNDYSTERYMAVFDAFLDALSIEQCVIAGNSFGGFLAWQYATHNTQRVTKLVLLDSSGYTRKTMPFNYHLAIWPITRALTYVMSPKPMVERSLKKLYGDTSKVDSRLVDHYHGLLCMNGNRKSFSQLLRAHFNPIIDYSQAISTVSQPTLILWGELDSVVPVDHAHLFANDIRNSSLILYPDLGHLPMEESPQKTAHDVASFLHNELPRSTS